MNASKSLLAVSCIALATFFGCSNNPIGLQSENGANPHNTVAAVASYKINCGGTAASPFAADQYSSGGSTRTVTNAVSTSGVGNPAPQAVYKSERYGAMTYTFPNLTAGTKYTVRLHFAETYWNAAGKRKFNVSANGIKVLSDVDIYVAAGGQYKAYIRGFVATANSSGQIKIAFTNIIDNASICGIEILPLSFAPVIKVTPGNLTVFAGTLVTISASVTGGSSPYLINFDNGMWSKTANPYSFTYDTYGMYGMTYTYYCWVTDANGTWVTSPAYTITIM